MENKPYPTPHICSSPDKIAKTVLMPGDPKRSEFVAKNFLTSAELFNDVRGVKGYTGYYKGKSVSVMASGMGMPSMGIYSYELFNFFEVDNIIRIGSAGAISPSLRLRDIVLGMGACTNSSFASQYRLNGSYAPIASFELLRKAAEISEKMGLSYKVGNLLSSDTFYADFSDESTSWGKLGVLAVEMEAAALYLNAARASKNALAICTVSDSLVTGEALSAEERQNSFTDMMTLALDLATSI
ncbi:MAG: purine-nucleoside phosphorylase [Ruminococcaceae bacterium]|nr:purine-nucleoside phosphorylase [Oscillospiraceae bacterium]